MAGIGDAAQRLGEVGAAQLLGKEPVDRIRDRLLAHPLRYRRGDRVGFEPVQPPALGRLAGVRVRSGVAEPVAVARALSCAGRRKVPYGNTS